MSKQSTRLLPFPDHQYVLEDQIAGKAQYSQKTLSLRQILSINPHKKLLSQEKMAWDA